MPIATARVLIGQILLRDKIVTPQQLEEALRVQREGGGPLGTILTQLGYASQEDITRALGKQFGMKVVDLDLVDFYPELLEKVPPSVATVYRVVPVSFEANVLTVAMADPLNVRPLDDLKFMLNCEVVGAIADSDKINRVVETHYASKTESLEQLIEGMTMDFDIAELAAADAGDKTDLSTIEEAASLPPIMKLVNLVLLQAIKDESSDVHFEPFEDEYRIRYRIDGVLYEMPPPPRRLAAAIASRIKVMASMDISERRKPQDSRIELNVSGRPVDLRVSTLPTMFGESVVLRVLDRSVVSLNLEQLGLRADEMEILRRLLRKPNGIILVTGPTGCGKTTTLYACISALNNVGVKIITVEDPVEYDLEGVVQVQVNEAAGVGFANTLRHILRQDPDKILVGEIRDLETAQMAIQASLTGHLVFSTLHTNDAPTTLSRLTDIGVEPYFITSTLEAVVAQRLVRKICKKCRQEYHPTETELAELQLKPEDVKGKHFYYGRGCEMCKNTGYRGRIGIFEIMLINDDMKRLVLSHASTAALRTKATETGMRPLRDTGLLAIYDGTTTIEEVVRETILQM